VLIRPIIDPVDACICSARITVSTPGTVI
jgi:hypothetical protein